MRNYGYGTGYFYPDLFLYFPVLLRLLGFSLLSCYKIFTVICTFFSLVSFYLTSRVISKNCFAGLCSAVLYGFCAYRCIAVFYRGALGEVQAFIFFPIIILGLYYLFTGSPERWWIFAIGFWGLLSCHIISLTLGCIITGVFLLFNIRSVFQDKRIFLGLLKSVGIVILLGASFLFPMAEQMRGNDLNMNLLLSTKEGSLVTNNINPFNNLFVFFHNWKYDSNYSRTIYPGWMLLSVPLMRLFLLIQKKTVSKCADVMLITGLVCLFISTDLFPWRYFVWFLNRIQFSWRLLAPASVLLSISGGCFFVQLFSKRSMFLPMGLMILLCFVCTYPIYKDTIVNRTISEDEFIMQDNRVAGMEYMPIGLSAEYIDKNRDTVISDPKDVLILSHKRRGLSFTFSFDYDGNAEMITFVVPLIRYYGYIGYVTNSGGESIPLNIERGSNGLVLVRINDDIKNGSVNVYFQKTGFEIAGEIITFLTVCAISVVCFKKRYKKNC